MEKNLDEDGYNVKKREHRWRLATTIANLDIYRVNYDWQEESGANYAKKDNVRHH